MSMTISIYPIGVRGMWIRLKELRAGGSRLYWIDSSLSRIPDIAGHEGSYRLCRLSVTRSVAPPCDGVYKPVDKQAFQKVDTSRVSYSSKWNRALSN